MPRIRAESIAAHKKLTRSEILEAAEQTFLDQGYAGATFADIAAAIGIGRTTLYEYFPSKDDLLLAYVESRVPAALADIVEDLPRDLARLDRILEMARRSLAYAAAHQDLAMIITRVGRKLPKPKQDRMWATLDPIACEIGRIVPAAIEAGEFAPGLPRHTSRVVADVVLSGVDMLVRAERPDEILEEVSATITDFLRRGLSP